MFLIYGKRTNDELALVSICETEAQMRIIATAIVQSPQWKDVVFIPTDDQSLYNAAVNYTFNYFTEKPELERKPADDMLIQALMLDEETTEVAEKI